MVSLFSLMAIRQLTRTGGNSHGVTLPKDDLELLLQDDPDDVENVSFHIEVQENGFRLRLL